MRAGSRGSSSAPTSSSCPSRGSPAASSGSCTRPTASTCWAGSTATGSTASRASIGPGTATSTRPRPSATSPSGRRIQVGWAQGIAFPGMPFNQQMTVPCELTLRPTEDGVRMFARPVEELDSLRVARRSVRDQKPGTQAVNIPAGRLRASGSRPSSASRARSRSRSPACRSSYDASKRVLTCGDLDVPMAARGRAGPAPGPGRPGLDRGLRQRRPGGDLEGAGEGQPRGRFPRPVDPGRGDGGPVDGGRRAGLGLGTGATRQPRGSPGAEPGGTHCAGVLRLSGWGLPGPRVSMKNSIIRSRRDRRSGPRRGRPGPRSSCRPAGGPG